MKAALPGQAPVMYPNEKTPPQSILRRRFWLLWGRRAAEVCPAAWIGRRGGAYSLLWALGRVPFRYSLGLM